MEKQLHLFETKENDSRTIWHSLPEENQQKLESIFVQLLIRHLSSFLEEVIKYEE